MFTNITMFAYIKPVKCNVQIINGSKAPAKGVRIFIINPPKTNIITPLWPSYYTPQNPRNTTNLTSLKHYNEFRNVRNKALRWVQMTTYAGIKFIVETPAKARDQQYWTSSTLIYLKLNRNILQVSTTSLYP